MTSLSAITIPNGDSPFHRGQGTAYSSAACPSCSTIPPRWPSRRCGDGPAGDSHSPLAMFLQGRRPSRRQPPTHQHTGTGAPTPKAYSASSAPRTLSWATTSADCLAATSSTCRASIRGWWSGHQLVRCGKPEPTPSYKPRCNRLTYSDFVVESASSVGRAPGSRSPNQRCSRQQRVEVTLEE
jgi:hypothetical protein